MVKHQNATILGLGAYLPKKVLSNSDLEKMVDTSDEWIKTRTGISERRISETEEFTSTLACNAAQIALKKAHLDPVKVQAILVATMTPDFLCPSTAALVQHALGAVNAVALDIQAACTGFIYALSIAKAWVEANMYDNVLVIAAEKNSAFVDYSDRNTCILFGDGAGACVVSKATTGYQINHVSLGADGEHADLIAIPGGGSRIPANTSTIDSKKHFITMNGKEVFKHAVRRMELISKDCLEKCNIQEDQLSWIVPHQANIRIIEALAKRFSLPIERVVQTIHKFGNTSASSIPIALYELDALEQVQSNEHILLTAFGGGLTWGATILTKL